MVLKTLERMEQDLKVVRDRELPEWALKLSPERQRMIRQAWWLARSCREDRRNNEAHEAADAILFGARR